MDLYPWAVEDATRLPLSRRVDERPSVLVVVYDIKCTYNNNNINK
jgi:hypothetical protein